MIVKNNYAGETGEKTEEWSDCYFSGQVCAIACDTGEYILGSFKGFRNIAKGTSDPRVQLIIPKLLLDHQHLQ